MQATTTTTTPETTTTTSPSTTVQGDKPGIAENIKEAIEAGATGVGGDKGDDAVEAVVSAPFDALNEAAGEMAGSAFGDLAEIGDGLGDPASVVLGDLTLTFHMIGGFVAFAAIATSMLFMIFSPRKKLGERVMYLSASATKFLVVSSLGVTVGVAMVELSGRLTNSAILFTLPETVNTEDANLFDAGFAVTVVPMVGVAFDFQQFFVGLIIAFWPLAAAVSIFKKFKNALPVMTALLCANVLWPPLAALAIGKAFAALPSIGSATWWCLGAMATIPISNLIALAAKAD